MKDAVKETVGRLTGDAKAQLTVAPEAADGYYIDSLFRSDRTRMGSIRMSGQRPHEFL